MSNIPANSTDFEELEEAKAVGSESPVKFSSLELSMLPETEIVSHHHPRMPLKHGRVSSELFECSFRIHLDGSPGIKLNRKKLVNISHKRSVTSSEILRASLQLASITYHLPPSTILKILILNGPFGSLLHVIRKPA